MKHPRLFLFGCASVLSAFAACSAGGGSNTTGGGGGDGGSGQGGAGTATSTSATESVGALNPTTTSTTSGNTNCPSTAGQDNDGDGYAVPEDCNDCDENVNPGSVEVPTGDGPPADEDCDGEVDNVAGACDDGLALDDIDPESGAKAIGICAKSDGKTQGLLEAKYVSADGGALPPGTMVGILEGFGPNVSPRQGTRLLALSTGRARLPEQPGACGKQSCQNHENGTVLAGFPQTSEGCEQADDINDDIGLEVKLKAPTNATGYKFLFDFYTFEFPEFVCSKFNDQFIAFVSPAPEGSVNGNISFDAQKNPVSVNIAFFDVCEPSAQAPDSPCTLGEAELQGTGFDEWGSAGATGWLETQAPVTGGEEVSIRFALWDTGDQSWDSTVLVDGFEWIASGGTVEVGTKPNVPK